MGEGKEWAYLSLLELYPSGRIKQEKSNIYLSRGIPVGE